MSIVRVVTDPVELELQYIPIEGIAFYYHYLYVHSLFYFHYTSIENEQYVIPMTADTCIIHSLCCVM